MDRRAFLKAGGVALFTLGAGPSFLARAAFAAVAPAPFHRRKTLVTIFQRGAMDGLMAVPPLADPYLEKARPRLFMSAARSAARPDGEPAVHDLGVGFGLHPAFSPLLPLWQEKRLGIVHAVGSPDPTRSHFDAQDYMESGTPGRKGTPDGWLDRVLGQLGHEASPFRAVAAFWHDLGTRQDDVVVLTMTELGRTVHENGSGGTDHGHGSCLFVLGNAVDGGKVHGRFPALAPDALYEGRDLPVTTDFRAVFAAVAGRQFKIADDAAIFPGWRGPRLPLFRA